MASNYDRSQIHSALLWVSLRFIRLAFVAIKAGRVNRPDNGANGPLIGYHSAPFSVLLCGSAVAIDHQCCTVFSILQVAKDC
jgi:hypothetical protein